MVKVLLTGGSGFIAAHIVDILLQHGYGVRLPAPLTNTDNCMVI